MNQTTYITTSVQPILGGNIVSSAELPADGVRVNEPFVHAKFMVRGAAPSWRVYDRGTKVLRVDHYAGEGSKPAHLSLSLSESYINDKGNAVERQTMMTLDAKQVELLRSILNR